MERGLEQGQLQEDELMFAHPMSQSSRQRAGLNGVKCRVHGIVRRLGIRTDPVAPVRPPVGPPISRVFGPWCVVLSRWQNL